MRWSIALARIRLCFDRSARSGDSARRELGAGGREAVFLNVVADSIQIAPREFVGIGKLD